MNAMDVDEVRTRTAIANRLVHRERSLQVGPEALIDGRIERNRRRAVNDDIEVVRKRRRGDRKVAIHDLDPLRDDAADALRPPVPRAQLVEERPPVMRTRRSARRSRSVVCPVAVIRSPRALYQPADYAASTTW